MAQQKGGEKERERERTALELEKRGWTEECRLGGNYSGQGSEL